MLTIAGNSWNHLAALCERFSFIGSSQSTLLPIAYVVNKRRGSNTVANMFRKMRFVWSCFYGRWLIWALNMNSMGHHRTPKVLTGSSSPRSRSTSLGMHFNKEGWPRCWEHSPFTNMAQVQIPASKPYMGWVCCWFNLLLREIFLRAFRFSPLLKTQHFQIPIRSGTHRHV